MEDYSSQVSSNAGESYVSSDGLSWVDLSSVLENSNACIKAFTDRDVAPEAAFVRTVTLGAAPLTVSSVQANYAISNFDTGIYLYYSDNNMLYRNIAILNNCGIVLKGSGDNKLRFNEMGHNEYNLVITDFISLNDIDASNNVDGKCVYYVVGKSDLEINASSGAGVVFCIDCQNVTVCDLDLKTNYLGIVLSNTSTFLLEKNTLANNYIGMYLLNSRDGKLINNSADSNIEYGFLFENASENTIENNTADSNSIYGLFTQL
ncbi:MULTISPECIES: NosD domain-containing protein [unclassified Methanosarcina]|uniref:NosD domain-containing protein n=1 Tax=unclassified Methanosarcina TaxID=2644672 RepID=UPI000615E088|nr:MULTISPECIES: NosD domain-containing protein [unclassified Methanosarcina]AKB18059.1 surface layer protein B [Methanosarcina sp. WWM596]AKB21394.1 surface layer protein B [Methanosarcina sp. WH1]